MEKIFPKKREKKANLFSLKEGTNYFKMRPILPSAREKKRYIVFEILSEEPLVNMETVYDALKKKARQWFGEFYASKLGLYLFLEKWNKARQRGLIKVNRKFVDTTKALFCLVTDSENKRLIMRSIKVSGTIKKAAIELS